MGLFSSPLPSMVSSKSSQDPQLCQTENHYWIYLNIYFYPAVSNTSTTKPVPGGNLYLYIQKIYQCGSQGSYIFIPYSPAKSGQRFSSHITLPNWVMDYPIIFSSNERIVGESVTWIFRRWHRGHLRRNGLWGTNP